MNRLKVFLSSKLMHFTWDLAYMDYSGHWSSDILNAPYHVIRNPYKKKWFADPFILYSDEKEIILLVEEFDSQIGRGRIAKIIVDKTSNLIVDCKIILDLPTHLSFPAIYRINNETYVMPENSASGGNAVYKYDDKTDELTLVKKVSESPVVDTCLFFNNAKGYALATVMPNPNGNKLSLFFVSDTDGTLKYVKDFCFSSNVARMGGAILPDDKDDCTYIRPAQNCNGDYGKSIIFQKMTLSNGGLQFEDIGELKPRDYRYAGIHTFNTSKDVAIIDLKKYDYPLLHQIRCLLKSILLR